LKVKKEEIIDLDDIEKDVKFKKEEDMEDFGY
jgi:hypothetical protein